MKKLFVVLGIAFVVVIGMFAFTNKETVEDLNDRNYATVEQELVNIGYNPDEFNIRPTRTVDGVVKVYTAFNENGDSFCRFTFE